MQEQECKCELDGFQGAVWTGDCPLHGNKPMTNNNWIEEFYKKFTDGVDAENGYYDSTFTGGRPCNVESFISNLITKKDQEHKAELEMIKGEIRDSGFSICSAHQKYDKDCFICKSSNVRTEDAISILDSHINKLSTE